MRNPPRVAHRWSFRAGLERCSRRTHHAVSRSAGPKSRSSWHQVASRELAARSYEPGLGFQILSEVARVAVRDHADARCLRAAGHGVDGGVAETRAGAPLVAAVAAGGVARQLCGGWSATRAMSSRLSRTVMVTVRVAAETGVMTSVA